MTFNRRFYKLLIYRVLWKTRRIIDYTFFVKCLFLIDYKIGKIEQLNKHCALRYFGGRETLEGVAFRR